MPLDVHVPSIATMIEVDFYVHGLPLYVIVKTLQHQLLGILEHWRKNYGNDNYSYMSNDCYSDLNSDYIYIYISYL